MIKTQGRVWHLYPDGATLQQRVAEGMERLAAEVIGARGAFFLVLAGGNTPRGIYKRLRDIKTDWRRWHVYFGDERVLPVDHPDRNSVMAREVWLDHVDIPQAQVHPIPAELGAGEAALRYDRLLRGTGSFDLVLLGLGEDGHTASLFPGQDWGEAESQGAALVVEGAPKPPPERVSLSAWRLAWADNVWFVATGEGKRAAVAAWRGGESIPAAAIRPDGGVDVFLEACCY